MTNKELTPMVRLIALPYLGLTRGRIDRYVPEGKTVAEHLQALGWNTKTLNARVMIDGRVIEQAEWEYAVPRAGQACFARMIPMGGGQGKDALRIVAVIAVMVAAYYVSGGGLGAVLPEALGMGLGAGTTAAGVLGAITSVAGMLAVTARMPPARPRLCAHREVSHG